MQRGIVMAERKTKGGEVKKSLPMKAGDKVAGLKKVADSGRNVGEKESGGKNAVPKGYVPRLKKMYKEKIAGELFKELGFRSSMQIPKLEKIIVSMGLGEALSNKKILDAAVSELSLITGQQAVKTKAKKSIANFKVREGQEIGARVTLRGTVMYEFLDRLVNVALPRVKDFRGINGNAFDGHGNYALGITEQIIFPEIDFDKIERVSGLNIVIVTTAKTDAEAKAFLSKFGFPFRK
jgi:large subunit ribosomal protein L5